jgi:hypothetical protein
VRSAAAEATPQVWRGTKTVLRCERLDRMVFSETVAPVVNDCDASAASAVGPRTWAFEPLLLNIGITRSGCAATAAAPASVSRDQARQGALRAAR